MRRILFIIFLLNLALSPAEIFAFDGIVIEKAGVDLATSFRSDQLDWSISGDTSGGNPNILSELSWDNIEILQLQVSGWLELGEFPYLKRNSLVFADISFGKIISGEVQDSDYAADSRSYEWSRSVNEADQGVTIDLSGAIGPIFELSRFSGVSITPLFGYGFNMQALSMTGGEQTISDPVIRTQYFGSNTPLPPDIGKMSGLDSSYTTYWYGPWLGVNVDYQVNDKLKLAVGAEYHWVEYFAQADWNLRSDFDHPVSFDHEASGTGIVWDLKGQYKLNEKWSLLLSALIQNWETESGIDRTYFSDGSVGRTRLNQVNWDSYALTTGMQYLF